MSFQPVLPVGGYAGWKFLGRTLETQQAAFAKAPANLRDADYFRANIAKATTAEALVADHRLMKVALGAFGLDDDLPNKAFIRKVLGDGTLQADALSNRLSDKRYAALAKAFGYDLQPPRVGQSDFADKILTAYDSRQFEAAVGDRDGNMRLALALQRDLGDVAAKTTSEATKWFTIMGTPPLRTVFEGALGLPSSFATLDIDRQLETLQDKTAALFGTPDVSQFSDPAQMEKLVRLFLVRAELADGGGTVRGQSVALQLLQGATGGGLSLLG
jgi:hypothetical protein